MFFIILATSILLISPILYFVQFNSQRFLKIEVEISLYGQFNPGGFIHDFRLSKINESFETFDNITKTFDYNQKNEKFSYLLIFSLNGSSDESWEYKIEEKIESRGNYDGIVTTCVETRGSNILTVELIGFEGANNKTYSSKSRTIEIF